MSEMAKEIAFFCISECRVSYLKLLQMGEKTKTFCIFYNAIVQLVLIPFILLLLKK